MIPHRLAFTIARRELRGGLRGFRILLLCVALGVSAIAGVGSLSDALVDGLRRDGRLLLGGDVELRLSHQPASAAQLAYLQAAGQVSEVIEMRSMVRRMDGSQRGLIELKGVDGRYPLYGRMQLDQGRDLATAFAVKDGLPGAVAEAVLLQRLKLQVGDQVRVGEATYRIAAAIQREPDRGADAFVLGPRLMVAKASLQATALIREGSQVKYRYRIALPADREAVAWVGDLETRFPDAGWRIRDVRNGAPGLKRFIDRMRLFLTLVGLTALLVGGLGIGNAVRSFLEGKTGTIATLKCLGAPSRLIFQVYLLLVMTLTGLGVFAGLVAGAGVPPLLSGLLADLLPFQIQFNLHPLPLLLAAAYGFLTALAFAIWPLARAQGVPAGALFRDLAAPALARPSWRYMALAALSFATLAGLAILTAEEQRFAIWFVCGAAVAMAAFLGAGLAIVNLARRLPRPRSGRWGAVLRLALTNLYRPGAATIPVVQSFGLGLSVLVAVIGVEGNMNLQINEKLPEKAPAFFFIDILPDQVAPFEALARAIGGVEEIQHVPALRGRIVRINGIDAAKYKVAPHAAWAAHGDRGLTYTALPPSNTEIVAGQWWPADYSGPPLISFDAAIAEGMNIGVGDYLTLNVLGREIEAEIANLRRIDWATLGINFVIVFAPGALEGAPQTFIATAKTTIAAELPLQMAVTDTYPNITAIRIREALEAINGILRNIGIAVRSTAAVALAAGVLVLAGAVAANHRRRVYEAVVLKVLGATRRRVLATYFLEYSLLGLITASLAAGIGTAAAYAVVAQIMGMPWFWLPGGVLLTTLICLVVTVGAGMLGTWLAMSQKPAPLLRNE
ncbi:MAG: FtsX-like permease family protein [Proteobacteria bacterium]|nr:FtsX-like permease family protein [Pseudomonadota bacterium]